MRILMLNPPFLKNFSRSQRSPAVTKSGTLYFPLWLASAAGVLQQAGFEVDLVDAPADGYDIGRVTERARNFAPDLLVVDTSTPSIFNDIDVAAGLKEQIPGLFVILVGTHVSALPGESLAINRAIDAVARREYDFTLRDLASVLKNGGNPGDVPGISYRNGDAIVHNPDRPLIDRLDDLPFVSKVYREFLNIRHYFNPNALHPMVTIITSRGCAFHCSFCVYPQVLTGHRVRLRSIENVVDEILFIREAFPEARSVFFEDDTLTVNKARCKELSERIIAQNIRMSWTANARADLDYDTMNVMKKSGCRMLCVGFESGNQAILDEIQKNIKVRQMKQFMRDANRAGILVHGCFMAGLPGETSETLRETLRLAERLKPDTAQFYPVMVYPGTRAYAWYQERGYLVTNDFSRWITTRGLHNTVIRSEHLAPEDLVRFCDRARRAFYLRPYYLLYSLKQVLLHPDRWGRTLKAARTFLRYLLLGSDVDRDREKKCGC